MMEEKDLICRAARGDAEAFRQLVEAYQTPAYRLAARMCGPDSAEDVTQEAFLAAWRALPEFRGDCRFSTWLYRLVSNAAIDCLRREKKHRDTGDVDDLELPDGGPSLQEQAERSDTRDAVRRALDRLSPEHRQVLLLRFMQELDYGEIAQVLDVSEGTVKSRINRAKSKLREMLAAGNFFDAGLVLPTEETERREQP
mgnify:FL=1